MDEKDFFHINKMKVKGLFLNVSYKNEIFGQRLADKNVFWDVFVTWMAKEKILPGYHTPYIQPRYWSLGCSSQKI